MPALRVVHHTAGCAEDERQALAKQLLVELAFAWVTTADLLAELRLAALQGTAPAKALALEDAAACPKNAGRKGAACARTCAEVGNAAPRGKIPL